MTVIDFTAEVEKRKEDLLADLFSLLEINSERDDSKADAQHPFGPGPVKALEKFLEIADRDGYPTKNVDNYAGHFEFGEGEEVLGIFAHMDVVPAGSGWDTDPYTPTIKDGRLYARGASDDKGPTTACYYGLKIIKELGLPTSKKVRFIVGTDEESGWADMDYYFEHVGLAKPDFGFSPDAEFPIINGEKGNITEYLHFAVENTGAARLHSFTGGLRENMVPESATAVISGDLADLQGKLDAFVAEHKLRGEIQEENGKYKVTIIGKSAHGAMPASGVNGATYLALFLSQFEVHKLQAKMSCKVLDGRDIIKGLPQAFMQKPFIRILLDFNEVWHFQNFFTPRESHSEILSGLHRMHFAFFHRPFTPNVRDGSASLLRIHNKKHPTGESDMQISS